MKTLARERDKTEILRRLRALRPDSRRRWGRMSVHQMVCHLADSFRAVLGQMSVADIGSPFSRTVVKWIALYLPLPWPPGLISTVRELDQVRGNGTKPGDFDRDVAELAALTEVATGPGAPYESTHPLFGRMSLSAWLRWGYLHMDHHLRQFGA